MTKRKLPGENLALSASTPARQSDEEKKEGKERDTGLTDPDFSVST